MLQDEPLHLALAYDPGHNPGDVFLFEVVGGFAGGQPNPERNLFEVTYGNCSGFASTNGEQLHLVLTSPEELQVAVREHWPLAVEVAEAIRQGNFELLFEDDEGSQLLDLIRE
ncbi:MAG: hypothetical protein ACREHD_33800 [Pirellulales bacterium]